MASGRSATAPHGHFCCVTEGQHHCYDEPRSGDEQIVAKSNGVRLGQERERKPQSSRLNSALDNGCFPGRAARTSLPVVRMDNPDSNPITREVVSMQIFRLTITPSCREPLRILELLLADMIMAVRRISSCPSSRHAYCPYSSSLDKW
jgi:hypothetical protein